MAAATTDNASVTALAVPAFVGAGLPGVPTLPRKH
jgi:hypothetical protein